MKPRTALVVATLLLFSVSAFAAEPLRLGGAPLRDHSGKAALDVQDKARGGRVPKLPYILDGVQFSADTPLPDVGLTWIVTPEDLAKGTVHIFTSREVAKAFLKQHAPLASPGGSKDDELVETNTCRWTGLYSVFDKDRGCGGAWFGMYPPDYLTELDSFGFNNSISCVAGACDFNYYTALYSCRDFEMNVTSNCGDPDVFYVLPGELITDLTFYGFNNRTSSIRFE